MAKIAALMPVDTFVQHLGPQHLSRLRALADDDGFAHAESLRALKNRVDADRISILLTGWGSPQLTPDVLRPCPSLKLVAHCAGSLRPVVDPALFRHGIRLTNCASVNAIPVAEFILSWIIRWNKGLHVWERQYRDGKIDYSERILAKPGLGNCGKTVGVVAASRVGRHLIALLRHFDLEVVLYDPFLSPAAASRLGAVKVELPALMANSDIVSINAPLLADTERLIGKRELARMRDGALLINTSRGGVLDHDALLVELESGRLNAVLDVTDPEPLPAGSPFFRLENVVVTPHIAGSIGVEVSRLADSVLDELSRYLENGRLENEVTEEMWATAA